jgi:hypothetical protein
MDIHLDLNITLALLQIYICLLDDFNVDFMLIKEQVHLEDLSTIMTEENGMCYSLL